MVSAFNIVICKRANCTWVGIVIKTVMAHCKLVYTSVQSYMVLWLMFCLVSLGSQLM